MTVNIVWFKRDIRISDHAPLKQAINSGHKLLLLYIFEPSLISAPQSSLRHWRFVYQSICDINKQLIVHGHQIQMVYEEAEKTFQRLIERYEIAGVYSHQEIGLDITFQRDKRIAQRLKNNHIPWYEYQHGGVIRGLKNRDSWRKAWYRYMSEPMAQPDIAGLKNTTLIPLLMLIRVINMPVPNFGA